MVSLPEAIPEPAPKASSAPRRMNPTEIEFALQELVSKPYDAETFPYDLIANFNASKVTVSRLKSGTTNKATQLGDVLWQKQFFFRPAKTGEDVGAVGDALIVDPLTARHKPRFIVVTNGQQVHVRDLKLEETINVEFERLDEQSYMLLPLAGYERRAIVEEHPADIKAAKKLKKLYDAILAANPTWNSGHHSHELNLLITRLLFCFYAEDTGIFDTPNIFTNTVTQHTTEDGSDVAPLLDRLFRIMNTDNTARPLSIPAVDAKFPYVNGSLFEKTVAIPQFGRTARRQLLECGNLDWTTINPDIFGSMIQTIAQDDTRSDLGMHYTSIPNIMKVLQPLFLNDLFDTFQRAQNSVSKLETLMGRLSNIRVFDPACGSGNFLIIAYKQLRALEITILKRIIELSPNSPIGLSGISLEYFFGIDVVDFACETAKLSLWIAQHQTNSDFRDMFGITLPTLPLAKIATIRRDNSLRLSWKSFCPTGTGAEVYICGNPPYLGHFGRTNAQNEDMDIVFNGLSTNYKDLDYVACWVMKLADYLCDDSTTSRGALVTTNSIYQGEQVPLLWPIIQRVGVSVNFAYPIIDWENNAAHNAGVTCAIVGFAKSPVDTATWYDGEHAKRVKAINYYLTPTTDVSIVTKADSSINGFPPIKKGLKPLDGGTLTLTPAERDALCLRHPAAEKYIKRLLSGDDLLNDKHRYIIVVADNELAEAQSIAPIAKRLISTTLYRETHGSDARRLAAFPNRFGSEIPKHSNVLAIPQLVAESRAFVPVTTLNTASVIPTQQVFIVDNFQPWLFAILSSRLMRLWMSIVGGKMRRDYRFSSGLVYNTFPLPKLSEVQQNTLSHNTTSILRARGSFPGKTLGFLYSPLTTPQVLNDAHRDNDAYLEEAIYGCRASEELKLTELLFSMYSHGLNRGNMLSQISSQVP